MIKNIKPIILGRGWQNKIRREKYHITSLIYLAVGRYQSIHQKPEQNSLDTKQYIKKIRDSRRKNTSIPVIVYQLDNLSQYTIIEYIVVYKTELPFTNFPKTSGKTINHKAYKLENEVYVVGIHSGLPNIFGVVDTAEI